MFGVDKKRQIPKMIVWLSFDLWYLIQKTITLCLDKEF